MLDVSDKGINAYAPPFSHRFQRNLENHLGAKVGGGNCPLFPLGHATALQQWFLAYFEGFLQRLSCEDPPLFQNRIAEVDFDMD